MTHGMLRHTVSRIARIGWVAVLFGLLALTVAVAPVSAAPPSISTTPNPIIIPYGQSYGDATLHWNSGKATIIPLYCVQDNGAPEGCFPSLLTTPSGSLFVHNGAQIGHSYVARIYTPDHSTVLASETVTTQRPSLVDPNIGRNVAYNPDPGCIVCGQITDPRAVVTNPVVNNPATTNTIGR